MCILLWAIRLLFGTGICYVVYKIVYYLCVPRCINELGSGYKTTKKYQKQVMDILNEKYKKDGEEL